MAHAPLIVGTLMSNSMAPACFITRRQSTMMTGLTNPVEENGISGQLSYDGGSVQCILIALISVAFYNVVELILLIFLTFRRRGGLYFWSLLLSSCLGVVPYTVGFLLKFFSGMNNFGSVSILTVGWWFMVTGQSVVLYSRLHLVLQDERVLRCVLGMIIATFLLLHVPTTILTFLSNMKEAATASVKGYNIMEKIQLTGFTIQETIISALYVYETIKLLRLGSNGSYRKTMYLLVSINIFMFIMDLILLGFEFANVYAIQITLKGLIYSIKLKLEFAVLKELVDLVDHGRRPAHSLALSSFQCANNPISDGPVEEPNFYGVCRTRAERPAMRLANDEEVNAPTNGKIIASKNLSTWVENRSNRSDRSM